MGSLAQISFGAIRRYKGFGAEPRLGSGGFWCGVSVRFWRVLLQILILREVVDGSGADIEVRFRKVPVQILRSGLGAETSKMKGHRRMVKLLNCRHLSLFLCCRTVASHRRPIC